MSQSGLVITQIHDVTVVVFTAKTLLETAALQDVANELYALVEQQARRKVLLDFRQVRMLSSQVLGVLIALHKKSTDIGGRVIICGLRPELHKVFKITRLDHVLEFADDEREALRRFGVHMEG
jgi:anti-sigma B factor antagonist